MTPLIYRRCGARVETRISYCIFTFQRNQTIRVERQLNNEINQLYKMCPRLIYGGNVVL